MFLLTTTSMASRYVTPSQRRFMEGFKQRLNGAGCRNRRLEVNIGSATAAEERDVIR